MGGRKVTLVSVCVHFELLDTKTQDTKWTPFRQTDTKWTQSLTIRFVTENRVVSEWTDFM